MPFRLPGPDLILRDATILTMSQSGMPANALAIKDGRIMGVGDVDEMMLLSDAGTTIESAEGRTLIPGLIDAHNHLLATGNVLRQISLYDCRSIGEIVARVSKAAEAAAPGEWLLGRGWDESLLAEKRHPLASDLDPVSPHNPVVLHRVWNKLAANSLAMTAAGITSETPDPPASEAYSGSFDRDADGNPTGLFRDRAKDLITAAVPEMSILDMVESIETACRAYNAVGLTGDAEPGLYPDQIRAYHEAALQKRLTVRVEMLIAAWGFGSAADDDVMKERILSVGVQGGFGNDLLRLEGVKFMPDGGVGDRTARMFDPYLNEPENRGQWIVDPDDLTRLIRWVHDLGYSIDTHTCGDEAQEVTVAAYAEAQTENPNPRLRHRVHHAYFPTEKSLALMAAHKIPAIVSNPFIKNLGESYVESVGEEKASRMMPMRTYLDRGIPLAGSSDSSVSDYNPWVGMAAAMNRETVTGRVLGPDEAITIEEALLSYTMGGAWATGRENLVGSLEVGKLADLVMLEASPFTQTAEEIATVKPVATMLGGRWVFDRR